MGESLKPPASSSSEYPPTSAGRFAPGVQDLTPTTPLTRAPPTTSPKLRPLTEAVAGLASNAAQTLDQGADGSRAGRRTRAGQPVQQVVGEFDEQVRVAGSRQVAESHYRPFTHGQAWAAELWQQAMQKAGVEGA